MFETSAVEVRPNLQPKGWLRVPFSSPGLFPTTPIVFTTIMTENSNRFGNPRAAQIDVDGFDLALETMHSLLTHMPETVGWLAFSGGQGMLTGYVRYEARSVGNLHVRVVAVGP